MKKMNTMQFKKKLQKLTQEELVSLIIDSCKGSPLVFEFIRSRLDGDYNVVDIDLMKKWTTIPHKTRELILNNCFCTKCRGVVGMVDYTLKSDKFGLILVGKCNKCGFDVVRSLAD